MFQSFQIFRFIHQIAINSRSVMIWSAHHTYDFCKKKYSLISDYAENFQIQFHRLNSLCYWATCYRIWKSTTPLEEKTHNPNEYYYCTHFCKLENHHTLVIGNGIFCMLSALILSVWKEFRLAFNNHFINEITRSFIYISCCIVTMSYALNHTKTVDIKMIKSKVSANI